MTLVDPYAGIWHCCRTCLELEPEGARAKDRDAQDGHLPYVLDTMPQPWQPQARPVMP
jgi:hypothetical protein